MIIYCVFITVFAIFCMFGWTMASIKNSNLYAKMLIEYENGWNDARKLYRDNWEGKI